jgi:hypothetical protein
LNIPELKIKVINFIELAISKIDIASFITLLTDNKIYYFEIKNGSYLLSLIIGLLVAILLLPVISTILIIAICYMFYQYNKVNKLN